MSLCGQKVDAPTAVGRAICGQKVYGGKSARGSQETGLAEKNGANYTPRMPKKSPRMGRPPLDPEEFRERITIRLPRRTLAKLAEIAGGADKVRAWIERLIETAAGR